MIYDTIVALSKKYLKVVYLKINHLIPLITVLFIMEMSRLMKL